MSIGSVLREEYELKKIYFNDMSVFFTKAFLRISGIPGGRGWESIFDENFDDLIRYVYPEDGKRPAWHGLTNDFFRELLEHILTIFQLNDAKHHRAEKILCVQAWAKYGISPLKYVIGGGGNSMRNRFFGSCLDCNYLLEDGFNKNSWGKYLIEDGFNKNSWGSSINGLTLTLNHYRKLVCLAPRVVYDGEIRCKSSGRFSNKPRNVEEALVFDLILQAI